MWRLTNQIMSFGQSSTIADKLRDLRLNLHSNERSLLEHHSKLIDFGDKYVEYLAKFKATEIAEDKLLLRIRKTAYENCEAQVKAIKQRIVSAKRDITNIEKEEFEIPDATSVASNLLIHLQMRMILRFTLE